MHQYLDVKLRKVAAIQQCCFKCKKWFTLTDTQTKQKVADYELLKQLKPVPVQTAKCTHCGEEQMIMPIGKYDHPNAEREKCTTTFIKYKATGKTSLIDELNTKRVARGLKALVNVDPLTKDQLEHRIHHIDTMPDGIIEETVATTAQLLARLNAIRLKTKSPRAQLKKWGGTREQLEAQIEQESMSTKHVTPKKGKTRIADGATRVQLQRRQGPSKMEKAVKRLDKGAARAKLKAQRALADDLAARAGFTRTNVMRWLQVSGYVTLKDIPDDWNPLVRKFAEDRHAALRGSKPTRKASGVKQARTGGEYLTPADLAALTGGDPRSVRIFLRRHEKDLKPAWRAPEGGRWAFVKAHQETIVKFIGGK